MLVLILVLEILLVGFYVVSSIAKRSLIDKKTIFYSLPVFLIAFLCNTYAFINYSGKGYDFVAFSQTVLASLKVFAFELKETWAILAAESNALFQFEIYFITVVGGITLISSICGFLKFSFVNALSIFTRVIYKKNRTLGNKIDILHPKYIYQQVNQNESLDEGVNDKFTFSYPKHYHDLVLGLSKQAIEYCKLNKHAILYIDPEYNRLDSETRKKLYINHIPYLYHPLDAKHFNRLFFLKGNINLICFDYPEKNLSDIYDLIKGVKVNEKKQLTILIEINARNHTRIDEELAAIAKDYPYISTEVFNRYDLMSREFSLEHNFAKYLPRDFYDETHPYTIKKEKEINVHLVGFGKTGSAMLESILLNNQFAMVDKGAYHNKKLNIYLYDKNIDQAINRNQFLNFHNKHYLKNNPKQYLPLPEPTFVIKKNDSSRLDLDSQNSLLEFYDFIKQSENDDSYNFFFVCLDNDINNHYLASEINKHLNKDNKNIKIFYNSDDKIDDKENATSRLAAFGYKNELLKHEIICHDEVVLGAIYSDIIYDLERLKQLKEGNTKDKEKFKKEQIHINPQKFYQLKLILKKSNLYQRINFEFKFNLMGLALAKDGKSISVDEFNQYYKLNQLNHPNADAFLSIDNKNNVLGYLEHARWCMFYELNYYTQLEKASLVKMRKNEEIKKHGCLTSWSGLKEFLKCAHSNDLGYYKNDFYPVEYSFDALNKLGYHIVIKE